jgi:glycyl-tRNA synthetase beta chain
VIEKPGRAAGEIVADVVPDVIRKFPWPKSMRWGEKRLRWVRPLHSILCVLDGEVVPFEVEGIESGRTTLGHRRAKDEALRGKPLPIEDFAEYKRSLEAASVVVERARRVETIREGALRLAAKEKLDWVEDHGLVDENAGLAEWPVVLAGSFETSFLDVPQEVLITSMKAHQKCFSLREPRSAKLANRFLMVANLEAQDGGNAIIAGNERVIRARLSDAQFFWKTDKARGLDAMRPKLDDITFHEKLGTQGQRVERLKLLARELAPIVGADPDKAERAAELCKADLVSETVGEFPELQGLIGRYLALEGGEDKDVADAIADHYKPAGQGDDVPSAPVSIAVALADKIDLLTAFWSIGDKPTGSKDPYALRRAALGIVRIMLENAQRAEMFKVMRDHTITVIEDMEGKKFSDRVKTIFELPEAQRSSKEFEDWWKATVFDDLFNLTSEERYLDPNMIFGAVSVGGDLMGFFADRLKVHLREQGARYDLIDAVFALPGQDDLLMIVRRVGALGSFLDSDDGANLLAGVKRAQNILRIEEKKDKRSFEGEPLAKLLTEPEEKALAKAIAEVTKSARTSLEKEDFEGAMSALAQLRAPVDAFFDKVIVNDENKDIRENRLKLLSQIRAATLEVADFSKIAG